eukprot:2311266-Rhodomonas_salina.1
MAKFKLDVCVTRAWARGQAWRARTRGFADHPRSCRACSAAPSHRHRSRSDLAAVSTCGFRVPAWSRQPCQCYV